MIEKVPDFKTVGLQKSDINKLEYMDRCVKESMRMYPPVPIIGKKFNAPVKTGIKFIKFYSALILNFLNPLIDRWCFL